VRRLTTAGPRSSLVRSHVTNTNTMPLPHTHISTITPPLCTGENGLPPPPSPRVQPPPADGPGTHQ
jgi:hypothetical protein